MSENERNVHVANYIVSKDALAQYLRPTFGPCRVGDPFPPRKEGQVPFGFAMFDNLEDAQACLATRKTNIDGHIVQFSPYKSKNESQSNTNTQYGLGTAGANAFSYGGGNSNHIYSNDKRDHLAETSISQLPQVLLQRFRAILSHADSIDEIYIQNVSGTRAVEYLNLQKVLCVHCKTSPVATTPQPNQIYAAVFLDDKDWYRCTVLEVKPDDSCVVQFVDYGNKSVVKKGELKKITSKMASVPPAAVKCHLKDFIVKEDCTDQAKEILGQWQELLVECETTPDNSIDLYNNKTGQSLRGMMEVSGCVIMPLIHGTGSAANVTSDPDSSKGGSGALSTKPKKNKKKHNTGSTPQSKVEVGAGDGPSPEKAMEYEGAISTLNDEKSVLQKQLNVAKKKIEQLQGRQSIDVLNKELYEKLASVRKLRCKSPAAQSGMINKAISLLSNDSYTHSIHEEIFTRVLSLCHEYTDQQVALRNLKESVDTVDQEQLDKRNESRGLFCEAVDSCQQRCEQLNVSDRRMKLNELLVKLTNLYPDLSRTFGGDIEETISNFIQWQASECEQAKNIQRCTEELLDVLSRQLTSLHQGLELNTDVSEEDIQYKLEESTKLVISALSDELETTDMSADKSKTMKSLCEALHTKIGEELTLLDEMHDQLNNLQNQVTAIKPYIGITKPEKWEWMNKKERKLKELKSKLRHRMADLADLDEADEDVSDTEISDTEKEVEEVRNNIHLVLIDLEEYTENLAQLTYDVFPEFAIQYPKLRLQTIQLSQGYLKPLRDIAFYKDTGSSRTFFSGESVVIKTMTSSANTSSCVPDIVGQISNCSDLSQYVNVDAVFFSKNGSNMYIQLSSHYEEVINHLADSLAIDLNALKKVVEEISCEPSSSTDILLSTDDETLDIEDVSDLATSSSDTNITS